MSPAHDSLESLKARIAGLERACAGESSGEPAGLARTGHAGIDAALGGGLMRARLHEIFAFEADDAGCATGFAAALALRLGGTLVWLREGEAEKRGGQLHAPGLAEIGLSPAQIILGTLPDALAVLRAAADVTRCGDVGVAVVELWRDPRAFDLTASRRLALAAEASGVTVIALRIAATPAPSAAQTRWQVAAAPSLPMEANAPGYPAWRLELLRQRGRPAGGAWRVEWNREQACLAEALPVGGAGTGGAAALSGAVLPLSAGRPARAAALGFRRAG
ncbi:ImuA family protein [Blastomonas sp.]|uniref:ImuA family protein n=1 Tax=Blastomonas sp. TaxID=1909299 RepID=UPI00406A2773